MSQEHIPLGPLATLMPLMQMTGVINDNHNKAALKSTRECQEQLVLLDRQHSMRVRISPRHTAAALTHPALLPTLLSQPARSGSPWVLLSWRLPPEHVPYRLSRATACHNQPP